MSSQHRNNSRGSGGGNMDWVKCWGKSGSSNHIFDEFFDVILELFDSFDMLDLLTEE